MNGSESEILKKFGLLKGACVSFKKIHACVYSPVPAGTIVEGVLRNNLELHRPVLFLDSPACTSSIERIWMENDLLFFRTATSIYQNQPLRILKSDDSFVWSQLHHVVTEKGSVYRYLEDGRTRRFKALENYLSSPKDVLVFVLDSDHADDVLHYVHGSNTLIRVVNAAGRQLMTNGDICRNAGPIFITLARGGTVNMKVPVSHLPKIGCAAFDQTYHPDGSSRSHLGHDVTKIVLKS